MMFLMYRVPNKPLKSRMISRSAPMIKIQTVFTETKVPIATVKMKKMVEDNEEKKGEMVSFHFEIEYYLYVLMNITTHPVVSNAQCDLFYIRN